MSTSSAASRSESGSVETSGPSTAPMLALSPSRRSGDHVYVSGSVAYHPQTGQIVGTRVEDQVDQTLANIADQLAEHGLGLADVVQARVYLSNIRRDFLAFDTAYAAHFSTPHPARTTVGVELAAEGLLVEIDVVAEIDHS